MALVIAMAMVLAMTTAAWAASDYKITVTNSSETVSINGKTFYAYKLFDATYSGTTTTSGGDTSPHAYSIKNDNWFYTITASKAALDKYFDFTASVNDATTMVVTIKEGVTFDDAAAYALAEEIDKAMQAATTKPTATASAQASGTSVTIDTGSAGYYIVTGEGTAETNQQVIAAVALTTTDPTAAIAAKVDAPTIDKGVQTAAATEAVVDDPATTDVDESAEAQDAQYADYNNASIGDTVSYKLDSKVPDMTGYDQYYYIVTDTLSAGLTLYNASEQDISNVVVKVGSITLIEATAAQVSAATSAKATLDTAIADNSSEEAIAGYQEAYDTALAALNNTYSKTITVNNDGTTTLKIVINNFINYKNNKGDAIVITYDAIVDSDAVIGVAGNPNDVKLEYSNNPNKEGSGLNEPGDNDDVTGETPEEKTYTYVTGVKLTKVNATDDSLEGAEFTITGDKVNKVVVKGTTYDEDTNGTFYKLKDGTYTETVPTDANSAQYASTETKYKKNTTDKVVTTTQTVTATARTKSDGTLEFDGLAAGTYTITEILAPSGYNLLTAPIVIDIGWEAPTGNSTSCTWTYAPNTDATNNAAPEQADVTITDAGLITFNIQNNTGNELPSTGGIGTTIFYVVGTILVIGAGVILITRRRMDA